VFERHLPMIAGHRYQGIAFVDKFVQPGTHRAGFALCENKSVGIYYCNGAANKVV
jgi:hypothetical protein